MNGLIAAALIFAGACDSKPAQPASKPPIPVFTTVYALADLVRQVGGKYVTVDFAIESGQSLTGFDPSDAIRRKMTAAQLIVAGGTTELWAVADASNIYTPQRVLRLDTISPGGGAGLEWLDPDTGRRAADEVARRLSLLRPENQVFFEARAAALKERLTTLSAEYDQKFRSARRRRVLALSRDFDPLALRFNVDVVHVANVTPDRLGDVQIYQLLQASRREHLVTLIVRADTPPALVKDLIDRTGFRVILIDAYGSSAGTGRDTYEGLLRYDMERLLEAVGSAGDAGG